MSSSDRASALEERLRRGDASACPVLFELFRPRLRQMLWMHADRRLAPRVSLSDILQDVYLDVTAGAKAYAKNPQLEVLGEGSVNQSSGNHFRLRPAADVLSELGLSPVALCAKEGLSLINGTQLTTALALKGWYAARNLIRHANLGGLFSRSVAWVSTTV